MKNLRCSQPSCSDDAEAVFMGFSLCTNHMDWVAEYPKNDLRGVTPGEIGQWLWDIELMGDELRAQGREDVFSGELKELVAAKWANA